MDELAAEAGLSKGSLYWYFESKEQIALALLERVFRPEQLSLEAVSARVSAAESIRRFTDAAIRDLRRALHDMPLVCEFLALSFRSRPVQLTLRGYVRRYVELLAPLVQRGINTGEFRRVEPTEAAISAAAIIEGMLLLSVYDQDLIDPAARLRAGIELLLRGLAA